MSAVETAGKRGGTVEFVLTGEIRNKGLSLKGLPSGLGVKTMKDDVPSSGLAGDILYVASLISCYLSLI